MFKHPFYPLRKYASTRAKRRFREQDRLDYLATGKTADPDFLIHSMNVLHFRNEAEVLQYIKDHYSGDIPEVLEVYRASYGQKDYKLNSRVADSPPANSPFEVKLELKRLKCWFTWFLKQNGMKNFKVLAFSSLGGMQSGSSPRISLCEHWEGGKTYIIDYDYPRLQKNSIKIEGDTMLYNNYPLVISGGELLHFTRIAPHQFDKYVKDSIKYDKVRGIL